LARPLSITILPGNSQRHTNDDCLRLAKSPATHCWARRKNNAAIVPYKHYFSYDDVPAIPSNFHLKNYLAGMDRFFIFFVRVLSVLNFPSEINLHYDFINELPKFAIGFMSERKYKECIFQARIGSLINE
jgi:hypothetical protein